MLIGIIQHLFKLLLKMPVFTRKGLVFYLAVWLGPIGNANGGPFTLTELGRYSEGVDYPVPDYGQTNVLDFTNLIFPVYTGAIKLAVLLWFKDELNRNAYTSPLRQIVVLAGSVGLTNLAFKQAYYPADDFYVGGLNRQIGLVGIADVAVDSGRITFPLLS